MTVAVEPWNKSIRQCSLLDAPTTSVAGSFMLREGSASGYVLQNYRHQADGEHCLRPAPEGRFFAQGNAAVRRLRLWERIGTESHS
jgi:hypothetical protein